MPLPPRANGPDPLSAWGRVRRRYVSQRKGSSEADSQGLRPPIGVRDLPRPSGPPTRENQHTAGGSGAATCPGGTGAGSCASLPLEDSPTHRIEPTHRIQCGGLRRTLPSRHAEQPLLGLTVHRVLPRYTVQPPAPHPHRSRLPH